MEYSFENKDIVKGSGHVSSQCSGSTELELGTVYAAELEITLFSDIDRDSCKCCETIAVLHAKDKGGRVYSYRQITEAEAAD